MLPAQPSTTPPAPTAFPPCTPQTPPPPKHPRQPPLSVLNMVICPAAPVTCSSPFFCSEAPSQLRNGIRCLNCPPRYLHLPASSAGPFTFSAWGYVLRHATLLFCNNDIDPFPPLQNTSSCPFFFLCRPPPLRGIFLFSVFLEFFYPPTTAATRPMSTALHFLPPPKICMYYPTCHADFQFLPGSFGLLS